MAIDPHEDFFGFYLLEHSRPATRAMHYVGTTIGAGFLVGAVVWLQPWFILAGLGAGYLFAWISHAFIERNKPATFRFPLRSFASDWRMWGLWITGRLGPHLKQVGLGSNGS